MDCHLAGRKYYEADEAWDKLHVGTVLRLEWDKDNRYDPKAVAVFFDDPGSNETYALGFIPRSKNEIIADFFEMGWSNIFECRISAITPDAHPDAQIRMTIKILRRAELGRISFYANI